MLTRPGSPAGPRWMRRLGELGPAAETPPDARLRTCDRRWLVTFWAGWAVMMAVMTGLGYWGRGGLPTSSVTPYHSSIRVAGLPLVAYGDRAVGVVAVGGLAVGLVAVGGVAVGGIAFGGVAVGGVALGGGAVGLLAVGGAALGYWALGGLAVGGYAYAGSGVALGYHEASGRQAERLFG